MESIPQIIFDNMVWIIVLVGIGALLLGVAVGKRLSANTKNRNPDD